MNKKKKRLYLNVLLVMPLLVFSLWGISFAGEVYRIGIDDVLAISVWKEEPPLNLVEVVVRPDGMISYPLLDDVPAQGKTPLELKAYLTDKLSPFIKNPIVTVIVRSINSLKIHVHGEVARAGSYPLREKATVAEVIALAGGMKTDSADFEKAYVMRDGKKLDVDFQKLFQEGDLTQSVILKSGDSIFVPDNFNSRLTVLGAVTTSKTINYRKGITIIDAILAAGGFTARTGLEETFFLKAYVLRNAKKINIDLQKLYQEGDITQNILLNPGDTIIIPDNFNSRITVWGAVVQPQTVIYRKGMTVVDAILTVGGFTARADPEETVVIRKIDGKDKRIEVDMEAAMDKGDMKKNIPLMPGDKIIVEEKWY